MPLVKRFSVLVIFLAYGYLTYLAAFPPLPGANRPLLIYSREDLKIVILRALKSAQKSIYLQIYALTDEDLLACLKQKAADGVSIQIFYDSAASGDLKKELKGFGIATYPVKASGLMHRKILIIDEETLFVGSANFTTTSLKMHDNVMMGLQNKELAKGLTLCQEDHYETPNLKLHLLPDRDQKTLNALAEALKGASRQICVALFTLTHPLLIDELIQAHQRGVEVKVAIDYYSGRGASKGAARQLQQAGVSVSFSRGPELLHDKWALIDDTTFIFGSANWTEAAFSKNQDCLILLSLNDPKQKRALQKMWQRLAAKCESI